MNNLKAIRTMRGYSLQELGDMCGMCKSQVHLLESQKSNPTLKNAYTIAKVLNIAVTDIWPNNVKIVEEKITVRRIVRD